MAISNPPKSPNFWRPIFGQASRVSQEVAHMRTNLTKLKLWDYRIPLQFESRLDSTTSKRPVQFQTDQTILNPNLAA